MGKGGGLLGVGWAGGRGIEELDACKIRSQKMMCDQVLWTADSMMMDTSQTERQIQCSHKDVMMNKFISLEEKMKELLHLLNSMICFK